MKIYDISQEVFSSRVCPGDPAPERTVLRSMEKGAAYNLTAFRMCAHNGTHIDAPRHFIRDGRAVDALATESFVGRAYVAEHSGRLCAQDARRIAERARDAEAAKRVLIKGEVEVSLEAAEAFAASGLLLLGVEAQSVGPEDAPMAVHLALLSAGVILLEGICLAEVSEGAYFLSAAPLKLAGADGAPCRAILVETER